MLEYFPEEITVNILQSLSIEDLPEVCQVCTKFLEIITNEESLRIYCKIYYLPYVEGRMNLKRVINYSRSNHNKLFQISIAVRDLECVLKYISPVIQKTPVTINSQIEILTDILLQDIKQLKKYLSYLVKYEEFYKVLSKITDEKLIDIINISNCSNINYGFIAIYAGIENNHILYNKIRSKTNIKYEFTHGLILGCHLKYIPSPRELDADIVIDQIFSRGDLKAYKIFDESGFYWGCSFNNEHLMGQSPDTYLLEYLQQYPNDFTHILQEAILCGNVIVCEWLLLNKSDRINFESLIEFLSTTLSVRYEIITRYDDYQKCINMLITYVDLTLIKEEAKKCNNDALFEMI